MCKYGDVVCIYIVVCDVCIECDWCLIEVDVLVYKVMDVGDIEGMCLVG